jgi:hypothetical protein
MKKFNRALEREEALNKILQITSTIEKDGTLYLEMMNQKKAMLNTFDEV